MLLAGGGYAAGPGAARRKVVAMLLIRVEASSIALDPPGIEPTWPRRQIFVNGRFLIEFQ
jgi:hypothetical protein